MTNLAVQTRSFCESNCGSTVNTFHL